MSDLTIEAIHRARAALPGCVRRAPLVALAEEPPEIGRERRFVKAECLPVTGACKFRAACNVLQTLPPDRRRRGVAVASSGNFAQAFDFAASQRSPSPT